MRHINYILIVIALLGFSVDAEATAKFLVSTGLSGACTGLYSDTKCWSLTTGNVVPGNTVNGAAIPIAGDAITIDANSLNQSLAIAATAAAASLSTAAGYTGTFTINSGITWTAPGALVFVTGETLAGTGTISGSGTGISITSGGNIIPWNYTTTATSTFAIGDNTTISGLLTTTNSLLTLNGAGFTLTLRGGWTCPDTTNNITGTMSHVVFANGTFSFSMSSGQILTTPDIEINNGGSGSITLTTTSTGFRLNNTTFKYTQGTFTTTGATFICEACTVTSNTSGLLFDTYSVNAGAEAWNGSNGFAINNYTNLVAGVVTTMATTLTYTINTSFVDTGTSASHNSFTSGGTAALNYSGSASNLAVAYVDATNTSNSGTNIFDYQGNVTGITGWTKGTAIGSGSGSGGGVHIIGGEDR